MRPTLLPLLAIAALRLPTSLFASLTAPSGAPSIAPSVFYDAFSTRIYDPKGRVLQLEYALEAARKGGAVVGAVSGDFVILASWIPRSSRRQMPTTRQEALGLWHCDKNIALAGTGLATDVIALADLARNECRAHRYIHDSPLRVGRLTNLLAKEIHDTERHRILPYAVDLLVAGYDFEDDTGGRGRPGLFKIAPAGVIQSFRACAVGRGAEAAHAYLSEKLQVSLAGDGNDGKSLREHATVVLQALVRSMTGEDSGRSVQESECCIEEDVSIAVVGKNLPYTSLFVSWDPWSRRMKVSIPKALAQRFERQE
ncbi:proteasome a type [Nannochloropsis gaditana]|uniref:Proteasome a type n=1 Tax=Nannochloropsis gaditana TaxID=72520 RepID=W7TCK8_9STRA|nr:proteasome a type [Nannochloropsis gaditana]